VLRTSGVAFRGPLACGHLVAFLVTQQEKAALAEVASACQLVLLMRGAGAAVLRAWDLEVGLVIEVVLWVRSRKWETTRGEESKYLHCSLVYSVVFLDAVFGGYLWILSLNWLRWRHCGWLMPLTCIIEQQYFGSWKSRRVLRNRLIDANFLDFWRTAVAIAWVTKKK